MQLLHNRTPFFCITNVKLTVPTANYKTQNRTSHSQKSIQHFSWYQHTRLASMAYKYTSYTICTKPGDSGIALFRQHVHNQNCILYMEMTLQGYTDKCLQH